MSGLKIFLKKIFISPKAGINRLGKTNGAGSSLRIAVNCRPQAALRYTRAYNGFSMLFRFFPGLPPLLFQFKDVIGAVSAFPDLSVVAPVYDFFQGFGHLQADFPEDACVVFTGHLITSFLM